MVGHTGNFDAAVQAIEALDEAVGQVIQACDAVGAACLITADHGNAEQMLDPDNGQPFTAHTTGPVPLWLAANPLGAKGLSSGALRDVAPTLLALLSVDQPSEMTGRSLLQF